MMIKGGIMSRRAGKGLYLEVARVIVETLKEAGLQPAATVRLATAITASICRNFAGACIYFPLNIAEQQARKASAIVAEFDGRNYRELALKHDLTENQVRNLVRRANPATLRDNIGTSGDDE
jgi:Mor family transcriptional regulator